MILNLYLKIKEKISQIREIKSVVLKTQNQRNTGTILVCPFLEIEISTLDFQTLGKANQQAECFVILSLSDKCFNEKTGEENSAKIQELENLAQKISNILHNFQAPLTDGWKDFNALNRIKYEIVKDDVFLRINITFKTMIYAKLSPNMLV